MSYDGQFLGDIPPEQRRLAELKARRAVESRRYRDSDKGKAAKKRYRKTPGGRAEHNRSKRNGRMNRRLDSPFVGVDGEGSEQAYLLLRAGSDYLHTGKPLTYRQCFAFIADLPEDATYVAFFFDYDVTMMCRQLPEERLRRLMSPQLRQTANGHQMPIDVDGYQIDYRPGKEFKVRRVGGKWRVINDVGSFFQCSFVKALTSWGIGSADEMQKVKAGKDMRSGFTVMSPEVIEYNSIECQLLAQLMSKFGAACRGIKYLPRKWQGPGELAASMLAYHDIPRRKDLGHLPLDLLEAANKSYYGGRFETTAIGILKAPMYALDINSAYPDSIRRLPCLEHGEWKLTDAPEVGSLYLAFGSFRPQVSVQVHLEPMPYLYGLPYRTETCNIIFPAYGRGWYWGHEIEGAEHQKLKIESAWQYRKVCECQPFDWIPELYAARKRWEADSDSLASNMGIALKLALNSLYGKMAQSVGNAPYANPIYASLITSLTRTKLYRMVHAISDCANGFACGHSVHYLATDGLFATQTATADTGRLLGQWSADPIEEDLLLVQPGLYLGADQIRMKTRGIPKTKVEAYADKFYQAWQAIEAHIPPDDPRTLVEIPFHQFLGLKQAVHFNRLHEAGTWQDLPRSYGFDWASKRDPNWTEPGDSHHRTLPPQGLPGKESLGYSKQIGRWLDENRPWFDQRVWQEAQPDEATASESRADFNIQW